LFATTQLDEVDQLRLQLANLLAGGTAPDNTPSALKSIFAQIKQSGKPGFLPVQTLNVESPAYPGGSAPDESALKSNYARLCVALERDAANLAPLAELHQEAYLEGLYFLLERFASNVPVSSTMPDVSIFDYNHTVTALCSVLRFETDERIRELHSAKGVLANTDPLAVIISGDIAGVQDFIYSLTKADQAAKQLRGRSFYLQALTEAVLRFILRGLDLPISSVIYSGGAHFYVLAPHSVTKDLDELRRTVTQGLLAFHARDLYLVIGSAPVSANDFQPGRIKFCWGALHTDLATRKNQRYAELIDADELYLDVFRPVLRQEKESLQAYFEQVGRAIPYATHVNYGIGSFQAEPANALEALNVSLSFDAEKWHEQSSVIPNYIIRYAIRDELHAPSTSHSIPVVLGTRYMVNLVPMSKQGEPDSFDTLARLPAFFDENVGAHGIKRLGILRMDVDNLGIIFKDGFGDRATLARIMALSRTLATFFEGRIAAICRQVESDFWQPAIYSVYAGGDDVFLVGPWHLMPKLAAEIRAEFDRLTLNHPDFTLSGGIALVAEKFPLYQAAEVAHEALEKAKAHRDEAGNPVKNAVCFFNTCANMEKWASEVESG
jgi:CRISPR-associated protein Csm1